MNVEYCKVEENKKIAKDTYKMKIKGMFVKECRNPGQFINIRIGNGKEFMLRRPISISEINRAENEITIIFRINGEGTKFLAEIKKNDDIDIIGPLGRGYDIFSLKKGETALLVGGGIGVPPLYELAKQFYQKGINVVSVLGFSSKEEVFYEEEFSKFGEDYISTFDVSYGIKFFFKDVLREKSISFDKYYSCGPVPMLKALVERMGEKEGYISLENRMACGVGACYACVCKKVKRDKKNELQKYDDKKVEYTRVCYDGPVYKVGDVELE
ncbi:MAG: dihydroorotate dehydrogenase electron transfer subunit [Fusobacterium sp.]|nr:dihydroorotate dehydrogenase electron transfer subunit [Fusobacterium sp.]